MVKLKETLVLCIFCSMVFVQPCSAKMPNIKKGAERVAGKAMENAEKRATKNAEEAPAKAAVAAKEAKEAREAAEKAAKKATEARKATEIAATMGNVEEVAMKSTEAKEAAEEAIAKAVEARKASQEMAKAASAASSMFAASNRGLHPAQLAGQTRANQEVVKIIEEEAIAAESAAAIAKAEAETTKKIASGVLASDKEQVVQLESFSKETNNDVFESCETEKNKAKIIFKRCVKMGRGNSSYTQCAEEYKNQKVRADKACL